MEGPRTQQTTVLLVSRPDLLSPAQRDQKTQPKKQREMLLAADGFLMQERGEYADRVCPCLQK
jgi:hypothetical protein